MKNPKLILVGAGPGDPDLISLKAVKALQKADVVLYDALVHPDLLEYAKDAECIFVGKKVGVCQFKQEDIHDLIIKNAHEKGTVVRLKGGDPYIFGRGHEELTIAKAAGIEVDVIPGISSCYSVPELQQIPLTRRGINESFWVVTGTTRSHELSDDIYMAVKSSATVVVLMGMSKLDQIIELYQKEGKGELPIAIIQNGSLATEKIGLGRINTILKEVENKQLSSPAIIVLGEVVSLHPLFGKE